MKIPSGTRRQAAIKAAATRRKNKATGKSRNQKSTSAAETTKKTPGNPEQTAEFVESHDDSALENDGLDATFPPLPIAVIAPGAEPSRVEYLPDPRAAFARARSRHEGMSGAKFVDPQAASLRISKHPLFTVVVIHADGTETVAVPCAKPVAAAQYLSGYNSGHVACGEWAEAREIDLESIRFTGRKLEHADVRAESKAFKINRPRRREQAAAAAGGAT